MRCLMNLQLIGLTIVGPFGPRFEVRLVENRLLLIDRTCGRKAFRSEPCPSDPRARDEWLWGCTDEIFAAVLGKAAGRADSGLLHDWLEHLDIPENKPP